MYTWKTIVIRGKIQQNWLLKCEFQERKWKLCICADKAFWLQLDLIQTGAKKPCIHNLEQANACNMQPFCTCYKQKLCLFNSCLHFLWDRIKTPDPKLENNFYLHNYLLLIPDFFVPLHLLCSDEIYSCQSVYLILQTFSRLTSALK